MSTFLLTIIFIGLLGIVVMIIYLIDRVKSIETLSRNIGTPSQGGRDVKIPIDERFGENQGQSLWRILSASEGSGTDPDLVRSLRSQYEPILLRHIEELFEEGWLDAKQDINVQPPESRWIKTTTGQIESWLPATDVRTIYNLGQGRNVATAERLDALRVNLDRLAENLFGKLGMKSSRSLSRLLVPGVEANSALTPQTNPEGTKQIP